MTPEEFAAAFKGSPMKRAKRRGPRRPVSASGADRAPRLGALRPSGVRNVREIGTNARRVGAHVAPADARDGAHVHERASTVGAQADHHVIMKAEPRCRRSRLDPARRRVRRNDVPLHRVRRDKGARVRGGRWCGNVQRTQVRVSLPL
jgi:hypothetical protein